MKTSDFIKESIGEDADAMHKDHEVQMARADCYNAAKNAIELHKMLSGISEMQGLEGWVSEKITLANDYLKTVREYLEYEAMSQQQSMLPEFTFEGAEKQFNKMLNEDEFNTQGPADLLAAIEEEIRSPGRHFDNVLDTLNASFDSSNHPEFLKARKWIEKYLDKVEKAFKTPDPQQYIQAYDLVDWLQHAAHSLDTVLDSDSNIEEEAPFLAKAAGGLALGAIGAAEIGRAHV